MRRSLSRHMAPAVAELSDDLLQKIFVLLPSPADLLRAAFACKPFLRAVRSAAFLRRFRRRHPSGCPPLLGCLIIPSDDTRRVGFPLMIPLPAAPAATRRVGFPLMIPSPAAPAATRRAAKGGDFSLSFLPHGGWQGGAPWNVLDCRNGRILLGNQVSRELAIADPMTRRCVSLPPPPTEFPVGYGLIADDGDSLAFQAVCISRDGGSSGLRALLLSSNKLHWADVAGLEHLPNLACSRAMQANRSLYWTLEGRERMVALNTASMEFMVLQLPPFLRRLSFDVVEKGEDGTSGLYLLTMRGFCIEVWAGAKDGAGGLKWMMVEKSVRFQRAMEEMCGSALLFLRGLSVVGVVSGVLFLRHRGCLLSIDLETMKLRRLSEKEDSSSELVYPYTMAWPPLFLNPTGQGA